MRTASKKLFPVFLALMLGACSPRIHPIVKFPKPNRPPLREVRVLDCLPIDGYEKPVCLPKESPFSFIETLPLLLNDEDIKNYLQALEAPPIWE